jgi:hypothetical protein
LRSASHEREPSRSRSRPPRWRCELELGVLQPGRFVLVVLGLSARSRRPIGLARRLYVGRGRVRVQFDKLRHVIIQRPLREGEHVVHVLLALVVDGRDSTKALVANTPCISLASYLPQHDQVGNRGLRRHLEGRRLLPVLRHDKQRQKPAAGIRVHARDAKSCVLPHARACDPVSVCSLDRVEGGSRGRTLLTLFLGPSGAHLPSTFGAWSCQRVLPAPAAAWHGGEPIAEHLRYLVLPVGAYCAC